MPEGRAQLFKIRRLVKRDGVESYEWYARGATWVDDAIDAFPYTDHKVAKETCENMKGHNRDPEAIYHTVVPA